MDASERELFAHAIRRATEDRSGVDLDEALDELGWVAALAEDRAAAVAILFEAQGEANATSSALDQVIFAALGVPGLDPASVVLPPLRSVQAPGRFDGARVVIQGLGTDALARGDTVIIVARGDAGDEMLVAPVSALKVEEISGLDAALGLVAVSGELERASPPAAALIDWGAALAAGQLALGHELVGNGRAMLELARQHALERTQFGRPIAAFQAVRHRLAESLVALEAAAALLNAASDDSSPVTAAMAKALAGRSARTVARHCQQVLAGIGFTTEHSLHRFVRRTYVLDQLLGAGSVLTRHLGTEVLAAGSLPAAFPL
ncbi:MAG TPA: acyl-CoA dehydrogenase family protein [Acidimicrobiales bacterium]|nr:acyl-CoA dehydrogenase family protein [Acidimicrobiales bacterium]